MSNGKPQKEAHTSGNTKEKILMISLRLFARDGYEAVSTSAIAEELGMTKAALYKHYKNKRDIFDCIVARMEERYRCMLVENLVHYSQKQFTHWTEDSLFSLFRKMLTLEQYHDDEMRQLYQKYLVSGPLEYIEHAMKMFSGEEPKKLALDFYAPMFFLYSLYDGVDDKTTVSFLWEEHLRSMRQRFAQDTEKNTETRR